MVSVAGQLLLSYSTYLAIHTYSVITSGILYWNDVHNLAKLAKYDIILHMH